jgi:AcrR family transcriptional regulator
MVMKAEPVKQARKDETAAPSLRERGKDERRTRLIRAARQLIAENEGGHFSMQELAACCGFSLATPYNLLGSKLAILHEVFRAEEDGFQSTTIKRVHGAPVQSVIMTVEALVAVIIRNANFYRGITRAFTGLTTDDLRSTILPISDSMFRPLIDGLIEDGAIVAQIPAAMISTHLLRVFNSTFLLWAALDWDEAAFSREMKSGFAFCFLGLFDEKNRQLLLSMLDGKSEIFRS